MYVNKEEFDYEGVKPSSIKQELSLENKAQEACLGL